jgi:hypothetical protein
VTGTVRRFLALEATAFLAAALVHGGVLVGGFEHRQAHTAESVIAAVLLAGLACSWLRSAWTRRAGLVVQGFALLGTLVGAFTIAIGIGPKTVLDIVYHVGLLVVLCWGLAVTARTGRREGDRRKEGRRRETSTG